MDTQAQEVVLPWNLIELDSGDHVYIMDGDDVQVVRFHKTQSEVAKRVVACVNACSGLSTEELLTSNFGEDSVEVGTLLGQTMLQRDDLREVAKGLFIALALCQRFIPDELSIEPPYKVIPLAMNKAEEVLGKLYDAESEGGHCD